MVTVPLMHLCSYIKQQGNSIALMHVLDKYNYLLLFNFFQFHPLKVAGKQKIGSLTVFFSRCVHKKVTLFNLQCCYGIALYVP